MTIEDLSARLENLERSNRRMRAAGIAVLVLVAAGVSMGQEAGNPEVIRAQRFEVVNVDGSVRGEFGLYGEGQDTVRLSLGLRNEKSKSFVHLYVSQSEESANLAIVGRDSMASVEAGIWKGSSKVVLGTGKDNPELTAMAHRDGSVDLVLEQAVGRARAVLGMKKDGAQELSFNEASLTKRVAVGVGADGPAVSVFSENGLPQAVLGVVELPRLGSVPPTKTPPTSLVFFDKSFKRVLERLPR